MFGIAWGVGSLLLLVGLGERFRSSQERELATLGQNIMFMFPGRIPVEGDIHLYIDAATLLWSTLILTFVGIVSGISRRSKQRA